MKNLLELISTLSENVGKELPKELNEINKRTIERSKEKGFVLSSEGFHIETRDIVNPTALKGNSVNDIVDNFSHSEILKNATFIPNLQNATKAPYLTSSNVNFALEGTSVNLTPVLSSKSLTPHRITTYVPVSKMVLNQCKDMGKQFQQILLKAVEDKLIETIFNDLAETDERPKGILNGITPTTLTTIDNVVDMMLEVDKAKTNNTFIISPTAKAKLLKLSKNYSLLDNSTLFGSNFIVEPNLKDSYIVYLDLSKLIITQFGIDNIIVDPFSDSINGNTLITISSYYDWDFVGSSNFMKVAKF